MLKKILKMKPSYNELFLFFLQLALYCKSGSTSQIAVNALEKQTENPSLKAALKAIYKDLINGKSLSEAISKQDCFPKFCAQVVRAGEESGELTNCLKEISYDMEQTADILRKIYSAVLPVSFAGVIIILALIIMMFFIVPYFQQIYDDLNLPLPFFTQILIQSFNLCTDFWYIHLSIMILSGFWFKRYFKNNPSARDSLLLKIPVYKHIHYAFLQYKFLKIFRLLYSSGISSMQAVEYTAEAVGNEIMAKMLRKTAVLMKSGPLLAQALERNNTDKILDNTVINLIRTGEDNGTINEILEEAANFYKKIVDSKTETFGTKITPIFLIPAFALVILIILSVQYPMLMLTQGV